MKVCVLNFSGNVGKSTIAKYVLLPSMPRNTQYISVETINEDGMIEGGIKIKGSQFDYLLDTLLVEENVIVDVGSSNIENFLRQLKRYKDSEKDFDYFVVPVVSDVKQARDSVNTILHLIQTGVSASRIRVIFNRVEDVDNIDKEFEEFFFGFNNLIQMEENAKNLKYDFKAAIEDTPLFTTLYNHSLSLDEVSEASNAKLAQGIKKLKENHNRTEEENYELNRLTSLTKAVRLYGYAKENFENVASLVLTKALK